MTDEIEKETVPKAQHLRLAADFDNFRKRTEAEKAEVAQFGSVRVVLSMLDVLDSLETALAHAPPDIPPEWKHGLERVGSQFRETMQKQGVLRIEVAGETFNPETMEAVSMADGGDSQTVKELVRAGYRLHDRVIRPARVIIYK